jgi:diguanylate cyclase (GGDEF)-like protein
MQPEKPVEQQTAETPAEEPKKARPSILVAEDEETLRLVISEVLRDEGYEVTAVESGERALEAFSERPYPVVVTDIVMGQMSGLELLDAIKARNNDTVVVIMTSHATVEATMGALRSGAYDFMRKPFEELDVITSVVNRAAEKAALIDENHRLTEQLRLKATDLNEANTALLRLADSLKESATRDGLTGLHNHRSFRDALIRELSLAEKNATPVSIMFMDVDHFKQFNDTHGHLAGDEALKAIASLTSQTVGERGFVARYGGEEFVALLPNCDKVTCRKIAEEVRTTVQDHPFVGRETQPLGKVTLSLGLATYPENGETPTLLIAQADQAVYAAKEAGRNTLSG